MNKKYRIIILGAGFSCPAGLPLASELWHEVRLRTSCMEGRASRFNEDLETYIQYRHDCDGVDIKPEDVNFEEFMSFLDIEHFLGLRGSDTWSDEGNEGTIITKSLIGSILAERICQIDDIPDLYLEFARRLQPGDRVITLNYDPLLEEALEAIEKPYRLFPFRYKEIREWSGVVDDTKEEVILLKMHGSIDWFDRKSFERRVRHHKSLGAPAPRDIIFSNAKELNLRPIVDGPRFANDPMATLYRAGNLRALYEKQLLFHATPRMLPPSAAKIVYANMIGDFWDGIRDVGIMNFGMSIIGFSLPNQDEYMRQILHTLVTNYQTAHWDEEIIGQKKSPLVIVDFLDTEPKEITFRKRYQFVDWGRAILHKNGFNEAALDSIFS